MFRKYNQDSFIMGWNAESAVNAYLDAVKLCKERKSACSGNRAEPQSTEFVSAMAAGMNARFIVEVCSGEEDGNGENIAPSTIGLAAAARHTGGRLLCILPHAETLTDSINTMKTLGLHETTEFVVGEAKDLLPNYKNVDFTLIDCKTHDYAHLFQLLNVNPSRAVVVANNLSDRKAAADYARKLKNKFGGKSVTLPIGKGMEVTKIGNELEVSEYMATTAAHDRRSWGNKSRWVVQKDERTGEEHLFRVVKPRAKPRQ